MFADQAAQRRARQQRGVTCQHHDRVRVRWDLRQGLPNRIPGASHLLLDRGAGGRRHGGQVLRDRFPLVPDHDHDLLDVRRVDGPQDVPEQGFTGYFMQHLGLGRFHAGAETGSQNDSNWMSHTMDSSGAPDVIPRTRRSCRSSRWLRPAFPRRRAVRTGLVHGLGWRSPPCHHAPDLAHGRPPKVGIHRSVLPSLRCTFRSYHTQTSPIPSQTGQRDEVHVG